MAALQSGLFTTSSEVKDRLQACADSHAHNIHRRHDPQGDAVAAIQAALQLIIPDDGIDLAEIGSATYGPTTARAVQRFKDTPSLNGTGRKILGPGQTTPDDIVGRQTIAALDAQLVRQGGSPVPTVTTKTQDVFVQILGVRPDSVRAGLPTEDGFLAVGAPRPDQIAARINDELYLVNHAPVVMVNFRGGGGNANPASDPTDKVVAAVVAARTAAKTAGLTNGKVCVVGFSIGGRGAATVCRRLVASGIPVTYLGLADAAFDGEGDTARTAALGASVVENIYEAVHHFVLKKFPEFEFHGDVGGQPGTPLDKQTFYSRAKTEDEAKFDDAFFDREKRKIATDHFNKVHDQAVKDNYPIIIRRAIAQLTGPRE